MARNAREEDRMARLRKRAEMEPSDDEEGSSDQHGEEGSGYGGSGGEEDGWGDEDGNDHEATTEPPNAEQVRVCAKFVLQKYTAMLCASHCCLLLRPQQRYFGTYAYQDVMAAEGAWHALGLWCLSRGEDILVSESGVGSRSRGKYAKSGPASDKAR